jgi:hypothetical protein
MLASVAAWPAHATAILPGNSTDITLTSAPTLGALGVSVTPVGTATIDASGAFPVASFPITGGTSLPAGLTILHAGSGLRFENAVGNLELRDFIVDTTRLRVLADVSVNGVSAFTDAPVFAIQPGLVLTLTVVAANELNALIPGNLFSGQTVIGTAVTNPITAVPVPAAGALLLTGVLALGLAARRRRAA